ncbi:MAG: hypothetical protein ACI8ZN_000163 [Bacteroidia bacterium]|jgi:hypothetical protein
MESSAQKLRQKAINLLYLIVLALLFTFIESDFVDTTRETNASLNLMCNEVERQSTKYNMMVLNSINEDRKDLFDDTKLKILKIDELTAEIIAKIETLKYSMIKEKGFNKFGFLKEGKSENIPKRVLLQEGNAKKLIETIKIYKEEIGEFLLADEKDQLDSILSLPVLMQKSTGNMTSLENYFFKKAPLNVAILNLSHFKSRLERSRTYVINRVIQNLLIEHGNPVPYSVVPIIKYEYLPGNPTQYIVFPDELSDRESRTQLQKSPLYVESLTDSIYAVGKPAQFRINFDTTNNNVATASIEGPNGFQQSFNLRKPGPFMFVPEIKGSYSIRINSNGVVSGKRIKVIDIEPIIQNNSSGTLYIGIDNILNIKTSEFENTEGLTARISDGVILQKGKNFYARVQNPGQVKVEIFAKMDYGYVKVAEKSFLVRELNKPIATVLDRGNGAEISLADVPKIRTVEVKSNEVLINEQYYVSNFRFTIIYNEHTSILKPIENKGSSLNSNSLEALKRAKVGDIITINEIQAKSSLGNEIKVSPVSYTVK